jgi:hypothetical protein
MGPYLPYIARRDVIRAEMDAVCTGGKGDVCSRIND